MPCPNCGRRIDKLLPAAAPRDRVPDSYAIKCFIGSNHEKGHPVAVYHYAN